MGYSNNKWRKILTILMIINLIFILFSKFSRVFASTDTNISFFYNGDNYTNSIPNSFNSKTGLDYVVIRTNSDASVFYILVSQSPVTFSSTNNYSTLRTSNVSNDNWVYSFMPIASSNFNNYDFSSYQGASSYTSNISFQSKDLNNYPFIYSNYDVYVNNEIVFDNNSIIYPQFDNITEIENGYPDGVFISPADFSKNDDLYFHLLEIDTGLSTSDQSIYYYSDKTFLLNKDSDYYRTWLDPEIQGFYYYIPRYKLSLSTNTSYLYVLSNSGEQIQNSFGILQIDAPNGIYDVVQSDTAGVITATEEQSDRMRNIEAGITSTEDTLNNFTNTMTSDTITEDTNNDIDTNLNFNNENSSLTNMYNGFFSRLTTMLSNLLGYDLSEDTTIRIPYPYSEKYLELHSNILYNNVTGGLRIIINAFWLYIFTFYMYKFINKLYIAISTGNILDTFSSSDEAITNDVL